VLVRPVALALIGNMVGARPRAGWTAGRTSGCRICIVVLGALVWRGAGRLALAPGLPPAMRSPTRA